jgi:MFS family permease
LFRQFIFRTRFSDNPNNAKNPSIFIDLKFLFMKGKHLTVIRWSALLAASFTMFGNYYLYDSVAYVSIEMEKALGFGDQQFGLFYSVYSIAAIGLLFVGGIFTDKYGTRLSILLFGSICTISGIMTAFSHSLFSMLVSRLILGLSAEPLVVAVTVAIARWFKGSLLGFALGINLFIARLGSSFVDLSPTWGHRFYNGTYQTPLLLAAGIGILCTLGAILYFFIEKYAEKNQLLNKQAEADKLELKGLLKFTPSFWYVVLLCVTFYSAIFPFRAFAPKFFEESHHITKALAGRLNSWLPMMAMFATPLIGLLVDKIGRRASMMFLGAALILPVFLLMGYTNITLYLPVILMGLAFSLIPAIMWPSVAYIVEENRLGKAYGLMTLIQQLGVMVFAWLIGWANDVSDASSGNPGGYNLGMWFFSSLGILAFIFSFLLWKVETGPKAHGLEKAKI